MPGGLAVWSAVVLMTSVCPNASDSMPAGAAYLTPPSTLGLPCRSERNPAALTCWRRFQILAVPYRLAVKPTGKTYLRSDCSVGQPNPVATNPWARNTLV